MIRWHPWGPKAGRRPLQALVRLLMACLLPWCAAQAAGPGAHPAPALVLGPHTTEAAVWQALRVRTGLPDGTQLGNLPASPDGWRAAPPTTGNLGPQRQPVALRLDWLVAAGSGGDWMLEIDYPSLDHIELQLLGPDGRTQRWTLGDAHPFSQRAVASRAFAVPLVLQAGQHYRLVGVVHTTGSMILPIRLVRPEAFRLDESRAMLLQGWIVGALFCLLVYALSLGRALREPAHLWFALNVLGTGVFFLSYEGLGVQHVWGEVVWAREKITMLAALLGLGSAFLYVDAVLDLARRSPWLSRTMRGLALLLLVALALFALGGIDYRSAYLANVVLSPAPLILALPTAWRLARAGDRVARTLLVGWAVFGACALCFTLLQRGLLPMGFWVGHAFQFGTLVELMTWMVVLGSRTRASHMAGELAVRERDLLATIAQTDALTGLLNRRGLQAAAEPLLARCDTRHPHAVYLIDLDRFKPINDLHGHDAGDAVLRSLAERLTAAVRPDDLVARIGGDEFVVMTARLGPDADADARALAQRLLQTVARPFDLDGHALDLGMTVGYALAPHGGAAPRRSTPPPPRPRSAIPRRRAAGCAPAARSAPAAADTPCPSCPSTQAQGRARWLRCSSTSVARLVPTSGTCSAARSSACRPSTSRRPKCAPMPARSTLGDHSAAVPCSASTWPTPKAAALRRMLPTLPASCSRSSTTLAARVDRQRGGHRQHKADARRRRQRAQPVEQCIGHPQHPRRPLGQRTQRRLAPGRSADHRLRRPLAALLHAARCTGARLPATARRPCGSPPGRAPACAGAAAAGCRAT
jgi:diguanylate cyclase (GGDEF)-like protein